MSTQFWARRARYNRSLPRSCTRLEGSRNVRALAKEFCSCSPDSTLSSSQDLSRCRFLKNEISIFLKRLPSG